MMNDQENYTSGGTSGGRSVSGHHIRERAGEKLRDASTRVKERAGTAREGLSEAYGSARERASHAYATARENAHRVREQSGDRIGSNPLAALAGGLALGAVLGALLPRTRREEDYLGDVSRKISGTAREAAAAAKEAGRSKLGELGINSEATRQKVGEVLGSAAQAATSAARPGQSGDGKSEDSTSSASTSSDSTSGENRSGSTPPPVAPTI